MGYRREVDGLRAIAVLSVIFSHAGFNFFSGGFVGVDIFFVISGYLITVLVITDLENKRFDIGDFYERRARRILPALFVMLLACVPFAWILLLPGDFQQFFESFLSVIFFGSNFFFWLQGSNYFALSAETQPLLHTWSLAIEEQFYLLFPVFLLLAWRFGRARVFGIIVLIALVSLSLSEWASTAGPVANFYVLPTRAWELLAGSVGAFLLKKQGKQSSNVLSLLGLAAIVAAILFYDKSTPFPSLYAVVPVGGALLVLVYAGKGTLANRFLSTAPLVSVGLISYSAYLWHQPLFAFARLGLSPVLDAGLAMLLIVATLILSIVSYFFIEKPFRQKAKIGRRALAATVVVSTLLLGTVGYIGASGDGFRDRWEPTLSNLQWASFGDRVNQQGQVCLPYVDEKYTKLTFCEYGDIGSSRTLVVYGDSHLDAISYQLDRVSAEIGLRVVGVTIGAGCGVIFDITNVETPNKRGHYKTCNEGFDQLLEFIDSRDLEVLVVSRWTFQMFPAPGHVEALAFDNGVGGIEVQNYRENVAINSNGMSAVDWRTKSEATIKLLGGLADSAEALYINYPIPEIGWDIFRENMLFARLNGQPLTSLKFPREAYYARNSSVISILEEVGSGHPNVYLIRADQAFCEDLVPGYCVAQIPGSIFYLDDDHLSDSGATLFLDKIPLFR
jgi:peptidoglycan/LPS O-acetylase OafA/YrhL